MDPAASTSAGSPALVGEDLVSSIEQTGKVKLTVFEKKVIQMAQTMRRGVPDKIMQHEMPEVESVERAAAINNLLTLNVLELFKQGDHLLYRLKTKEVVSDGLKNADNEERVVFDIIKQAANKGIWIRDIRSACNLNQTQLTKVLKTLEGKKLIKQVKSVAANKRKVYMLYDVEPDRSVTGGSFYMDQDFDFDFAQVLSQQCCQYLMDKRREAETLVHKIGPRAARAQALKRLEEVTEFIAKSQISKVTLGDDDIACILDSLIYDGIVERIVKGDVTYYVAVNPFLETPGVARTPCGVCPVMKDCSPNGEINPKSCKYLTAWLAVDSPENPAPAVNPPLNPD